MDISPTLYIDYMIINVRKRIFGHVRPAKIQIAQSDENFQ